MSGEVTRVEIADAVRTAFEQGPLDRAGLTSAAAASGARNEVVEVLSGLPVRPYRRLQDLWEDLADVPIGG